VKKEENGTRQNNASISFWQNIATKRYAFSWATNDSGRAGNLTWPALVEGTAVAQWLRCRATNRKVASSIPGGVSGFFIDIKSLRSHYGPGADSASNRNEYQEHFLGVKVAGE